MQTLNAESPDAVQGGLANHTNQKKPENASLQFSANLAHHSTGTFTKIVEDVQIELDVYPRLIYFQQILKDGTRPFLELV